MIMLAAPPSKFATTTYKYLFKKPETKKQINYS